MVRFIRDGRLFLTHDLHDILDDMVCTLRILLVFGLRVFSLYYQCVSLFPSPFNVQAMPSVRCAIINVYIFMSHDVYKICAFL